VEQALSLRSSLEVLDHHQVSAGCHAFAEQDGLAIGRYSPNSTSPSIFVNKRLRFVENCKDSSGYQHFLIEE
jgi:hypothetical protein